MRRCLALVSVAMFALLVFASAASAAARLYAPAYGSSGGAPERISAFDRAADGSLTAIAGSPFDAYASPFMVGGLISFGFTPDGERAVGGFLVPGGGVQGYKLSPAGAITPTNIGTAAHQSEGMAVSPDGRFAFEATREYPPGTGKEGIRAFSIAPDGSVSPIGVPYDPTISFGGEVAIAPNGRFLFAIGEGKLRPYAIGADGSLTPLATVDSEGVGFLTVAPDGRFLFGGMASSPGGIVSFAIGLDGSLTKIGEPAVTTPTSIDPFSVAPDGRHVYVPDGNAGEIDVVAVAADGQVSRVGAMPAPGAEATSVSPDGRFVYWFHGGGEYSIRVASIGADGIPAPLPFVTPWDTSEPMHFLFQPGPAPVASFTAKAAAPGAAAKFNASKSTNAAKYAWDFGDGTTLADGGPAPKHAYAKAGKYKVTLSLLDASGCGAKQIYTGQSTTCPGAASTTKTLTVDTLPVLTKFKLTNKAFVPRGVVGAGKRGTTFRFRLNEKAKVSIKIERKLPGRLVAGKCKEKTPANSSRKKCPLFKKLGSRPLAGKAGANKLIFNGKLKGVPLAPGAYRATAVATDSAKGRSAPRRVGFKVLG